MTTDEHIPELILSADAQLTLLRHGIPAWNMLFSILLDPEVDEVNKFDYLHGTVEFVDEEWYASYRILDNGDIEVSLLHRLSDLLDA